MGTKTNKIEVSVNFSILGETFPLNYITERLAIIPTRSFNKGEILSEGPFFLQRKETCWSFGLDYVETDDIMKQINKVIDVLEAKKDILTDLLLLNSFSYLFFIILKVHDSSRLAVDLSERFKEFSKSIKAEIEVNII